MASIWKSLFAGSLGEVYNSYLFVGIYGDDVSHTDFLSICRGSFGAVKGKCLVLLSLLPRCSLVKNLRAQSMQLCSAQIQANLLRIIDKGSTQMTHTQAEVSQWCYMQ